jgi:putative transposase
VKGRKRVQLCDMSGNLLEAIVVPANTDERACAICLFVKVKKAAWSRNLRTIFADNGFDGEEFEQQVKDQWGYSLEIVRRDAEQTGFVVLPKRWLIEQVFGCQGRNRRLSRDYEQKPHMSRATILGANIHRWLRRLKPAPSTDPPFRYRKPKSL